MKTILAIEDEPQVRANIEQILELGGFRALSADNGQQGLDLARQQLPDAIICDIAMPELDGYQVLAALRADPATCIIPLIFLTAHSERQDMRRGMQLGADDYLTKPFTPEELLDAVDARMQRQDTVTATYRDRLTAAETQLHYFDRHDRLTGLATAKVLEEAFPIWREQAAREDLRLPLLVLGIDQFQRIQGGRGHVVANTLLARIACGLDAHFKQGLFPGDVLLAYLSGDRFAILLAPVPHRGAVEAIAEQLCQSLSGTATIDAHELFITLSLGIAESLGGAADLNALLAQAEAALEASQQRGHGQYRFYDASLPTGSPRRLQIEADLRGALERQELLLYYQPQVDLASGRVVGAEALLRWFHDDLGAIAPTEFIGVAEETGLATAIGDWVLYTAAQQLRTWQQRGLPPLTVAVNLSACQLRQPKLGERLQGLLAQTGLQSEQLALELTESSIVDDIDLAARAIAELRALGFSVAIDDFGTGYSSLEYLQRLAADKLKIDRCFVCNIQRNPANAAIVNSLTQLADQLGKQLILEGIETKAELTFLQRYQGAIGQGYWFSRPLPAAEFERYYRQGQLALR